VKVKSYELKAVMFKALQLVERVSLRHSYFTVLEKTLNLRLAELFNI